jgi:hypothetical protein
MFSPWFMDRESSEYVAKFYLITDAITRNRTDGALVRVMTPIGATEELSASRTRAEAFTAQLVPHLSRFIPE